MANGTQFRIRCQSCGHRWWVGRRGYALRALAAMRCPVCNGKVHDTGETQR